MDKNECQKTAICKYGAGQICDFMQITGGARIKHPKKGKIVDGKCGFFEEEKPSERKKRRRKAISLY